MASKSRKGGAKVSRTNDWSVLPHGAIQRVSANLLRVEGSLATGPPIKRVMTVAKRVDGSLVIHSAIALDESAMRELEAFGTMKYLIVPNQWHRLDAARYLERYPDMAVFCPRGSRKKVEEVVSVSGTYDEFPNDNRVRLEPLAGINDTEGVMIVDEQDGLTLVFNDVLFNMPHQSGLAGWILKKVTCSSGGPRISRVVRITMIKDKSALRANLEQLADRPRLKRIIVSHHEMIVSEPARVLREVARTL